MRSVRLELAPWSQRGRAFLCKVMKTQRGMEFGASVLTLTFVAIRTAGLSALGAGHNVPPRKFFGTRFC